MRHGERRYAAWPDAARDEDEAVERVLAPEQEPCRERGEGQAYPDRGGVAAQIQAKRSPHPIRQDARYPCPLATLLGRPPAARPGRRVAALGTDAAFIATLAALVRRVLAGGAALCSQDGGRLCPADAARCAFAAGEGGR